MSIRLDSISKSYGSAAVVSDLSLEVPTGEFFVLLGSSGSGKTTVLKIIAGLTEPDKGHVFIRGRDVTDLPSRERNTGFVFQHYALFEHMTVTDNVTFGLRIRGVSAFERRERCAELLEMVGLSGLGARMPRQLSGGQQQRVALARALAREPEVLLLDEPLGALDAKIRAELRITLRTIQQQLGITTVMVTHDQSEAFELADRIGVMSYGRLLEEGEPQSLYQTPCSEFVATFLGTANLVVAERTAEGLCFGACRLPPDAVAAPPTASHRVQLLFRPEDVALASSEAALACPVLGRCEVRERTFAGSHERLRLRIPGITGTRTVSPEVPFGDRSAIIEVTRPSTEAGSLPLELGQEVWAGVTKGHVIAHPGLRVVIVLEGNGSASSALHLGGHLIRMAHARTALLAIGQMGGDSAQVLESAKRELGAGLPPAQTRAAPAPLLEAIRAEALREPIDLVIYQPGADERVKAASLLLQEGDHNCLLACGNGAPPARALVCAAAGEPGKTDVRFAGRLLRHFGAVATLLTVVSPELEDEGTHERAGRFLESGRETLELFGVAADAKIRSGRVAEMIRAELGAGGCELLVLGTPLAGLDGRVDLSPLVSELLETIDLPVLFVRYEADG